MTKLLLTLGHSSADREQLTDLLCQAGIEAVVDVRTAPGSRRNPDVLRDRLAQWMPQADIAYRWDPGPRRVP